MNLTTSRCFLRGCAALFLASALGLDVYAAPIVVAKTDNLLHNQTNSPFFTSGPGATPVALGAAGGWAPIAPTQAGAATTTSTTTKKSFSFVGDSTSAGNWVDGNGVPAGVTLTFDAQFTVAALPAGSLLTTPGATGGNLGNGIGVTQTVGGTDDIDVPDGLLVSPVIVSSVSFTGTPTEPGYVFTPGGVSGFGTILFRSNNFAEATAGALLTQGVNTVGFGTATGNVASNLLMENNFGPPAAVPSSVFPRQSGPYTLVVTQGVSVIKGITLGYDVTYDITLIPEPTTCVLAAMGLAALVRARGWKHRAA